MLRNRIISGGTRCLSMALALAVCTAVPAQALEKPPDAGTIADSVKERKLTLPSPAKVEIEIKEPQVQTPPAAGGPAFEVSGFRFANKGTTPDLPLPEELLQGVVKDAVGRELTLAELEAVAGRVAQYLNDRGFMVANAFIPPQKVRDGVVEIAVVPGQYGHIDLRNHSKLSDAVAQRYLRNLKIGDYVKKDELDRTLLLISDIGGITINATLAPGQDTGTSELIVELHNDDTLTSEYSLDNYGNRFTGEDYGRLKVNFRNLSGRADQAVISGDYSSGDLSNYGLDYILPVGTRGAKVGVGYAKLHYNLGQEFEVLDAHGTAKTSTIYGEYPLIRSRDRNLYVQLAYDHRKITDRIDQYNAFTDKHTNVWTVGLAGDNQDSYHGGGANSYALTVTTGRLAIDGGRDASGETAWQMDRTGLKTEGTYTRINLNFNRLQYINERLHFFLGVSGQWASKNLDSTEKLFLGGANGVRAYPQGEASGDEGYLITGELLWQLPKPGYQLAAFIDNGRVSINKNPIAGQGDNSRTLTGAGLGLLINPRKDYSIRVDYAWKLGSEKAISDEDKSGRWWFKGTRYF